MEKIKFENETRLTQDEMVDLLAQQTLPLSKILLYITSIVILIIILILNWDFNNAGLYITLTVMLSLALLFVILLLIFKKWLIKISNKQLANGVIYNYVFYENEFSVDSTIGDKTSHLAMKYSGLEIIKVKGDFALIYINNVSMFFVNLNNFNVEREEVLKLFSPYRKKKSKR